ncbi:MAG: AAA family ATPase, partial [Saprospiraceae bacterium]|nr:AAA family ATPase [Saprospiraceae bacterium]
FDSYSAGMKQKFALIRALLHNPKVLLLDEPAMSLDPAASDELHAFLRTLTDKGVTLLCATHDLAEAETLCDTFIILHQGKVCGCGTLPELRTAAHVSSGRLSEIYRSIVKHDA